MPAKHIPDFGELFFTVTEAHSTQASYIVRQSINMAFIRAWTVLVADATAIPDAKACGQDSKRNYFMDTTIPLR